MRKLLQRRDSTAAVLTVGVMSAIVVVAVIQTAPASASNSAGLPLESSAWFVSGPSAWTQGAPALPSGPITATSSVQDITALQTSLSMAGQQLAINGSYDEQTVKAVKIVQAKNRLNQTGEATEKTLAKLAIVDRDGAIDARCLGPGITLCVDKTQKVVRYFKEGHVVRVIDVNIGPEKWDKNFGQYSATRVGVNKVFRRDENAVSSEYGYQMPFFMQFDGGIGFHYSSYFEQVGYKETSMGCVTIGNRSEAKWLFENTPMKTAVVVYA